MTPRFEAGGRRRAALLLIALALAHLALWRWIDGRLQRPASPGPTRSAQLRLLELRLPPPALPQPMPLRASPLRSRPKPANGAALPREIARPPVAEAAAGPQAANPQQTEASIEPPARESLLDSEATRRALRQAAREPLLSERAAAAMGDGAPLGPEEKLGRQIQQAGDTDCLKGEFLGSGGGLLSLPFWALAEVRGKCRR